jgi:hypothetical protein
MYSRTGRAENRPNLAVNVRIASLEHQGLVDTGITENVSPLGMRAIVRNKWPRNEPVAVESPPGKFRSRAWVIYCEPVENGAYAVGLRLLTPQPRWAPNSGRAA